MKKSTSHHPEPVQTAENLLVDRDTGEVLEEAAQPYVHYYDKPHKLLHPDAGAKSSKLYTSCLTGYVTGKCSKGHYTAKQILCGKEWCVSCGEKNSAIHTRRIARWQKVHQLEELGYFVFTIPMQYRKYMYKKTELTAFYKYVKRMLAETYGFKKGVARWHWLGDCPKCKGDGCDHCRHTGAGYKWHPHLNILIESGFIPQTASANALSLERLKSKTASWLANRYKVAQAPQKTVINYQFTSDAKKKNHIINYVTRATMRHSHLEKIRETIYKFRASNSWGKWDKVEPKSEAAILENNCCAKCAKETVNGKKVLNPISWEHFRNLAEVSQYLENGFEVLEGGYLQLEYVPPPPDAPPKYGLIPLQDKSTAEYLKEARKIVAKAAKAGETFGAKSIEIGGGLSVEDLERIEHNRKLIAGYDRAIRKAKARKAYEKKGAEFRARRKKP